MFKTCLDCKAEKLVAEFNRNCRKPDGFDIYCKVCCSVRQKAARIKRKERDPGFSARKGREARAKDPQRALEYQRAWVKANRDKVREYGKKDYLKHREKRLADDKAQREANIDRFLARERASQERRKDQKEIVAKAWRVANPHKIAKTAALRRARIARRTPAWLTVADFEEIEAFYCCAQLMGEMTGESHHVDHIYPLKGRYVSGLHVPSNLQVITATENLKKNNTWSPE